MKTEKEKMLLGELYFSGGEELAGERKRASDMCAKLNGILTEEERTKLTKELLGKTGENVFLTSGFFCDYGYNIEVGENFYCNYGVYILDVC